MSSLSINKSKPIARAKLLLIGILLLLALVGSAPGYLQGQWRWKSPPLVLTLKALQAMKQTGLPLADWTVSEVTPLVVGEHRWVQETLTQGKTSARLLLLPQGSNTRQPEMEWSDVDGLERWQQDSHQNLAVAGNVNAKFFRAWTNRQTYGVLQWYALPDGGVTTSSQWFWRDRLAQWQNRRMPWVAVSILIKMEPLDDLSKYRQTAESLVQSVQNGLVTKVLKS
jgi:cyanoexosortase B-associated protein